MLAERDADNTDLREALRQIVQQAEKMAHDSCEDCYGVACIANGALARSEPTLETRG